MERRSSSPSRPRSIRLGDPDSSLKSASPSPASDSENRQWSDDFQKLDEITEYAREVDELLDHIKPFPRNQQSDRSDGEPSRPRLDHLENLIRLVEQLKDLKEKNCEQQERTRQFKEQRSARERRGILKCNREDLTNDLPPPPPDPPKKHRPSIPFRKNSRSKSISTHEYFNPERLSSHRKSISQGKAKVSKWTKVKEAFRWEKASQLETLLKQTRSDRKDGTTVEDGKTCEDMETSQIPIGQQSLYGHLLHVPEKSTDSPSPADSVLSGQISSCSSLGAASSSCLLASSGYSGEHSSGAHSHSSVHMLDLPESRHRFPHAEYLTQSLQELSSSSEDEKLEDSAFTGDHCKNRPIYDEGESRRSKSLDGEHVLGPGFHLLHLSKESLQEESKAPKQHKTPWGKVIDIIQTRKDSLKKRPKKRDDFRLDSEAFSSTIQPQWSSSDVHMSDDVSSPEDMPKDLKPRIEITYEKALQPVLMARRLDNLNIRPLTPVLTLTRPSTEELQKLPVCENEETTKSDSAPVCSSAEDIQTKQDLSPEEKVGRASRWGRVKKAFLTSASANAEDTSPGPSSAPSSPMYLRSFFSDNESDELSSGEWVEDLRQDKILEAPPSPGLTTTFLQAEVQRNYAELQQNISREMEANANACELVKCFIKAGEKVDDRSDDIPRKPRESLSIPLPTMDDLSPDFKKKLDEWKKIKKTPTTPTSSKEESQSHFISRIGEWQRWRPGSSGQSKPESHHFKQEHHFQDEFYKKLEEWQMLKSGKRSRSHSDRGKEERDYQTPSPGLSRKNSKGASKKFTSGKSSGSESLSGSLKEKEGRAGRKSQKEKDLQWLEKELHKIEREKLRLEREREKYLEREARLEQMKRTMGSTTPTQEVLIQTATGFYRFEGISQKFTKKLYEWEKARGIAPEASTFALLETASVSCRKRDREDRIGLQRSKSVGSVIDSSSAVALSNAHHPSSLSLNDVDELEAMEQVNMLDAVRMVSDEPEAIIVDVEDVVEETAAIMVDAPQVLSQVPVYSYAPAEVTQLIDSSGSDSEVQVLEANDERKVSTETLIEHNIGLLKKIEVKEAICREIENDLVDLNDKMSEVEEPTLDPKEKLLQEGEHLKHSFLEHSEQQQEIVHDLVDNLRLLHAANCRESELTSVSQVLDITSDLLSLAKKLEATVKERSISELQDKNYGKRKVNRIGKEKVWFSTDEDTMGNSDKLKDLKGEFEGSDSEVQNLPSLITKKVLELKAGLSALRYKTDAANKDIIQNECKVQEEAAEQNDVSFTVQVARSGARASVISISDTREVEARKGDDNDPDQKITAHEHSPPPVTFIIPSPQESRSDNSTGTPKRGLEKSKAQIICKENAEEEYEKNLAVSLPRKESKSPEVLKKKIREKILEMQKISSEIRPRTIQTTGYFEKKNEANDENKFVTVTKNGSGERLRKNLKARRITDTTIAYKPKIYIPTETRGALERENSDDVFLSDKGHPDSPKFLSETPKFVFVPTSRKIISPIETDTSSSVISYVIDDIEPKPEEIPEVQNVVKEKLDRTETTDSTVSYSKSEQKQESSTERYIDIGMPPLPNSPVTSRKLCYKETAPSIKLMIEKYNQKVTEKEAKEPVSGTSSPISWRSPILERRIKAQMDRFQSDGDNALKNGSKFGREVIKSASAGLIKDNGSPKVERRKDVSALKGILKSSSTGAVKTDTSSKLSMPDANVPDTIEVSVRTAKDQETAAPLALRALKIKQAKAEFLSRGPSSQSWTSDQCQTPTSTSSVFPWGRPSNATSSETRSGNRMSHLSVGSDSSYDDSSFVEEVPNLIKSASAGMLGLDRSDVLRRRSEGCVEQPCIQKTVRGVPTPFIPELPVKKSSKFGFSNIKSKFRKVKMRKSKDKESAVSTLCRQSLHLDVLHSNQRVQQPTCSKSCPASPVLDRSNSIHEDYQRLDSRKTKTPTKSKESCSNEKR